MQETLTSVRFVQAYQREADTSTRVGARADGSMVANRRLALTQLAFSACVGLTMATGTAAAVYVGAHRVLEGRLLLGDVLVFLAYLGMLYAPVVTFADSGRPAIGPNPTGTRVRGAGDRSRGRRPDRLRSKITLCSGTYRVPRRGLRLRAPASRSCVTPRGCRRSGGSVVAIVGRTGAGEARSQASC